MSAAIVAIVKNAIPAAIDATKATGTATDAVTKATSKAASNPRGGPRMFGAGPSISKTTTTVSAGKQPERGIPDFGGNFGGRRKATPTKKMAKGGSVSSASKRADGCVIKGKTKGKLV